MNNPYHGHGGSFRIEEDGSITVVQSPFVPPQEPRTEEQETTEQLEVGKAEGSTPSE